METVDTTVPNEDKAAQREIKETMRLPRWGCFLMIVGFFVPTFLAAVSTSRGAQGMEWAFTAMYWIFSALFFVGVVLVFMAYLKVRNLPNEREGPGSPR